MITTSLGHIFRVYIFQLLYIVDFFHISKIYPKKHEFFVFCFFVYQQRKFYLHDYMKLQTLKDKVTINY